jgi:hypothetical protein
MPGSEPKAGSPTLLCCHFTRIRAVLREVREYDALLEEISRTYAVVSLECPLTKGSHVRIDCGSGELRGRVTGCKQWSGGYLAAVTFPQDQPWQPAEFKPDGLFNPNYLVCENPECTPDCVNGCCESVHAATSY